MNKLVTQNFRNLLSNIFILIATFGTALFYAEFVKFKIGLIYPLELCFLGFALTAKNFKWTKSKWIKLFFIWGIIRFFIQFSDIISFWMQPLDPELSALNVHKHQTQLRVIQHCLVFIYPLLWMTAGEWIKRRKKPLLSIQNILILIFIFSILRNFTGNNIHNLSVGPLMGAFLIYTLHFYGINLFSKTIKNKLSEAIVACSLAFLTFFPFWKMWAEHDVKRGSLLCLILIMSASALILRAFKTYFISMFIFILGFISIAAYQSQSIKNGDDHNLWAPIQHSEDLHDPRYAHEDTYNFPIKAHVRKLWWRQTIEKWSENKILGIGFIDELPPEIDIGSKNDWKTVLTEKRFRSTSPVSGPHQSLLNILTRMGVIGFLIFTAILIEAIVSMKKVYVRLRQNPCFADLLLLMIPLGGFIYAMLNVGFEAPHNSILFWFVLGLIP